MKISGLKPIKSSQVLKAIELCEKEGESGEHGIEKEFAFTKQDLTPCQRVGENSAYKYVIENGRMPKMKLMLTLHVRMRPFVSLIIAINANTPFDYVIEDGKDWTILTGYNSSRWAKLPQIESTNYPLILKDYEHFQRISIELIEKGILIGANNYMPIRPKWERRLGEVSISLERASWFIDIVLDNNVIEKEPLLTPLKKIKNSSFITKLQIAEKCGYLEKRGLKLKDIIENSQKENVRRLLGVPLNRIEIRCEEGGGDYEFELAKEAFVHVLSLYFFCNPQYPQIFEYEKEDLDIVYNNEINAMKDGLKCQIIHPHLKKRMNLRDFFKETLSIIENFSMEIGYYNYLLPIYEVANGEKNNGEKNNFKGSSVDWKKSSKNKKRVCYCSERECEISSLCLQ